MSYNYEVQRNENIQRFSSEELAEKKAFLLKIAKRFNEAGIKWCLTCSSTLFFRGIVKEFDDFDFLIDWQYISKAIEIVKEFDCQNLPKGDQSIFSSTLFNKYRCGKVKFDLFSEWRISNFFNFEYCYNPDDVEDFLIEDTKINMISAKIQYLLYSAMSPWWPRRRMQAGLVSCYLEDKN